jgi:hypothetical protein
MEIKMEVVVEGDNFSAVDPGDGNLEIVYKKEDKPVNKEYSLITSVCLLITIICMRKIIGK